MKPPLPRPKLLLMLAVVVGLGGILPLPKSQAQPGAEIDVTLEGSKKVLNLGTVLAGFSRAQQIIGSAKEADGEITGLRIGVSANGATNAGLGLGAYAKAIEEIGVVESQRITQDSIAVNLQKEVKNAAAVLAGYADSEQHIGYMAGKNLALDAIEVQSAGQIINAAGALGAHAEAIQDVGVIKLDDHLAARATADSVRMTATTDASITNTAAAVAAQSVATQEVGEITATGTANTVAVTLGGRISNAADSLAAAVKARQTIGAVQGSAELSKVAVDIEGKVENVGGGIAAAATAEQEIGRISLQNGGRLNSIRLQLANGKAISNAASGYAGSGTAKQQIGAIVGDSVSNSTIDLKALGSIYNFGQGVIGSGSSTQHIGVIDLAGRSGSGDTVTLRLGNVSGSSAGLAGTGSVSQNIGVLKAGGHGNTVTVHAGNISGTARGVLGAGSSHETIGSILGLQAVDSSVDVTSGNIVTSAKGSRTSTSIEVGVLDGHSAQDQNLRVETGSITAEALGLNSHANIQIGVVDNNHAVDADIRVGDVRNTNKSVSTTTIIEVGHVYPNVTGPVKMDILTGNLVVDTLALGASFEPGIQVGNVKDSHGGKVNVFVGDIYVSPACIEVYTYLFGWVTVCSGKSLVRIGNIGISNKDKDWDL